MKHSLFDILIRPGPFFQEAVGEKANLKIPGLIVLVLGIISAVYAYLISGVTGKMMAGLLPGMETIIAVFAALGALIGIFIFWAIWAGVFYLISSFFKGNGTYKRTFEFIGYGYLPQIFGAILTLIVAIQYLPRVVVPQLASGAIQEDPQIVQEAIKTLMHDPTMMEMTQIVSIISIVFLLWSANIWISGIRNARQLSERDSALCVGIPVVLYILYMIYSMTGI
ncbi:MAG: Yip1 family protein [Methanoregula sp.]